jgi:hypothetical protein
VFIRDQILGKGGYRRRVKQKKKINCKVVLKMPPSASQEVQRDGPFTDTLREAKMAGPLYQHCVHSLNVNQPRKSTILLETTL